MCVFPDLLLRLSAEPEWQLIMAVVKGAAKIAKKLEFDYAEAVVRVPFSSHLAPC